MSNHRPIAALPLWSPSPDAALSDLPVYRGERDDLGLACPACGDPSRLYVADSRPYPGGRHMRRRKCSTCGAACSTLELIATVRGGGAGRVLDVMSVRVEELTTDELLAEVRRRMEGR